MFNTDENLSGCGRKCKVFPKTTTPGPQPGPWLKCSTRHEQRCPSHHRASLPQRRSQKTPLLSRKRGADRMLWGCFFSSGTENLIMVQRSWKRRITWGSLMKMWRDLLGNSSSATTGHTSMILNTPPRSRRNPSRATMSTFKNGQGRVLTLIQSRTRGETWGPEWWQGNKPTWPSLRLSPRRVGQHPTGDLQEAHGPFL